MTMITQAHAMAIAVAITVGVLSGCSDDPADPGTGSQDVVLAPPPAGQGFQVSIGPFDVPSGTEIQRNHYLKLPNDTVIYVTKIEFRYNEGSHHFNLFKSDSADVPDHVEETFSAIQWEKWDMVAASQKGDFTWTLPPGVAIRLNARQQMDFQTHYVNAGTQSTPTGRGKVIVNFWTTDPSNVTSVVGAVFNNNNLVNLPPRTSTTYCKVVTPFDHDVFIMIMTGHFHSRGKTFTVGHWDGTKLADTIYTSQTWAEPPVTQFATPLRIAAGDSLAYVTTYENRSYEDIVKFGPHVENEEHCNLFIFYYPGPPNGKAIYDISPGFIMESHPI